MLTVHEGAALPERPDAGGGSDLDRRPEGWPVDRHRARGLDLTPEELVARRSNRRLMLGIVVPSVIILVLALVATASFWNNEPKGPTITAPAGYHAVTDGYFGYAVPASWSTNPAYTDSAGDIDTSGPNGWAGEHRAYRLSPPVLGEAPPSSLQAFGMPRATPFQLVGGHAVHVQGAAAAFAYTATRPGGFRATVVDAWNSRTAVEVWLMVQAPPGVTATVLSTLRSS